MSSHDEYSFFRAAGFSLSAIETAERERVEAEKLKTGLCRKFGASGLACGMKDGHLRVWHFSFYDHPPDGWDKFMQVMSYALARPRDPADQMLVAAFEGLMERHVRRTALEHHFGCGDMPEKELPGGDYDAHFVRRTSVSNAAPASPVAFINSRLNPKTYSAGRVVVRDDLDYAFLDGHWYIRVPNDADGKPYMAPPDAEPVSFEHMIAADRNEYSGRRRNSIAPAPAPRA